MSDFGNNQSSGGAMFFSVRMGTDDQKRPKAFMATVVPKGTQGAIQAFNKDGTPAIIKKTGAEKWHLHYDYIEGRLASIENKTIINSKGKEVHFVNFTVHGNSTKMVLSLEKGDRYWVDLMKRLLNVELEIPIRFQPYSITDKASGKTNNLMMLVQGGKNIDMMWNAANKWGNDEEGNGGLPSGIQVEDPTSGDMVWSFLKRDRWLDAQVQTPIKAQLEAMAQNNEIPLPAAGQVEVEEPQHVEQVDNGPDGYTGAGSLDLNDEDEDQLPF
ncbi:MAG TPA: hypothetical protein PK735_12520 [Flavobacteriales bacterium]|nr:hypothetical protein [Flavobacteriales bacterium]